MKYFLSKNDNENWIRVLQKAIMHALNLRELNPTLTEMTMSSFLDVILSQNVGEWQNRSKIFTFYYYLSSET